MDLVLSFEALQKLHKANEIIQSGRINDLGPGHYDLTDDIYVNVMEYETKDRGVFESHHKYVDIHYIISGSELIEIAEEKDLVITEPNNREGDYVLGDTNGVRYKISEKQPFLVMPGEAHLPGLTCGEVSKIRKAVIKVPIF